MIFYIILFLLSLAGLFYFIFRYRNELTEQYEVFLMDHPANFAHFMTDISNEFYGIWNTHLRGQLLLFIEKRLRWFRIILLRIEHFLFRATHRVRDASNRNTNSTTNEASDDAREQDK